MTKSNSQTGFTLIEMMVVIAIMMILVGFGGWSYVRYRDQSAVEAGARTLKSALLEAKNRAKNGHFATTLNSNGSPTFCYVGEINNLPIAGDPYNVTDARTSGYSSYLEMIASGGIELESWGVYWDNDNGRTDSGQIYLQPYCKRRASVASAGVDGHQTNAIKPYYYPRPDELGIERVYSFESGISVKKPSYLQTVDGSNDVNMAGIEFIPLYLGVRAPVRNNQVVFGPSCFGEQANEIVIGDEDNKYLYKFAVGVAGDVSEGCFCSEGWDQNAFPVQSNGCLRQDVAQTNGPCRNTCQNIES